VVGLRSTDALELAESALDQALADARARACVPAMAFVLAHRGLVGLRLGTLVRAESDARTAIDLLSEHGIRLGTALALAVLIEALVEAGEVETAARLLQQSGFGPDIPAGLPSNPLLEARSLLRLAQGRTREGLDDMLQFGRRDELWGGANPVASRWRSRAAVALAALGEQEQARRIALDDLERARHWGASSGIGVALRACALVEGDGRAVDQLSESVEVLETSPARLEHARALTDLGAALRRANRRTDARAVLERGLAGAERCGAQAIAALARAELRAAGGRSTAPGGGGVLTASERRVADLAAEGYRTAEIAQALFVTRKTVETHLGRVYRKLGISGRGGLGRALAQRGGQPGPDRTA
jgi:DNA-binding CsgD family transcriptional regulator